MKYTQAQIAQMAKVVMQADANHDPRVIVLLSWLERKGWPSAHTLANIRHLSGLAP